MKERSKKPILWSLLLLMCLGIAWFPACQCGVTLRTDPEIGPRQLKTDLPDNTLRLDNAQRLSQTRAFLVYNDGELPLNVISFQIVDDNEGYYTILKSPSEQKPFTLKPGLAGAVEFEIRFRARRPGVSQARLRFFAPSADNVDEDGYFYIPMPAERGKFGPLFSCGDMLDFGEVPKGQRKEMTCEIKNAGSAPLLINGFRFHSTEGTPRDFLWQAPQLPLRIPPGEEGVQVRIVYQPSDFPPEKDEGVYIFETNLPADNDDEKPQLPVKGLTIVPAIALIPVYPPCNEDTACQLIDQRLGCREDLEQETKRCQTAEGENPLLKFPRTLPGKQERRVFLVRNIGTAPLRITGMEWVDESSRDFRLLLPFAPFVLAPKTERPIEVLYAPSDNIKDKGQIRVLSDAHENEEALLDVEAAAIGCKLVVEPKKIEFARAETRPVSLKNEGDELCQIQRISLRFKQDRIFSLLELPTPLDLIPPNASRNFNVQHNPDPAATPDIADIESNDIDNPQQEVLLIPFIERPEECTLIARPEILDYGFVQQGENRTLTATFFNIGRTTCQITAISVLGTQPANHTAFSLTQSVTLPLTLAEGMFLQLPVAHAPTQSASHDGLLVVDTPNGREKTTQVRLRSASGTPCLEVLPRPIDFGPSRFNCNSPSQIVRIFHTGAPSCPSTITIQRIGLSTQSSNEFFTGTPSRGLPAVLAANQSIELSVGYRPNDLGRDTGVLEIEHSLIAQSPLLVPLEGTGVQTDDAKDTFIQSSVPMTDILFVVDNSCSMAEEQKSLADNFKSFINWAIRLNADYHIGVTTTDTTNRLKPAGCLEHVGTERFVSQRTPDPIGIFQQMSNVGTRGSAVERGFEAAYRALIAPTVSDPKCNQGFYRPEASLSLVFISDEPDQSPNSESFYFNFFRNIKGPRNANMIRASAVVGPPPDGCRNPGTGRAMSAPRYWNMAQQLRGERASICDENWANTLSRIGAISFGLRDQFFLTRYPDPLTLLVKVNGTTVPQSPDNGWIYESTYNSIIFAESAKPPAASRIEVEYKARCQ